MVKLQIKDISKHFGPIKAIDHLSINVMDGELLAVLGPSGCGKSTLLACIAGIEKADQGEIWYLDRCFLSRQKNIEVPPKERNIGFVFQNYALWPHMTIFQNIAYPLKMRRRPKDLILRETRRILHLIRLEDKAVRHPHELSGGEQQRVALGRALIMNPDLLLLDEPLSNLDARLRENMQEEIRSIQKKLHLTVIHVTHDQSEAMAMADRIAVMNHGRLLQTGKPEDIYEKPAGDFVATFVGRNNLLRLDTDHRGALIYRPKGKEMPIVAPVHRKAAGGSGTCAVRPEDVVLFKNEDAPEDPGVGRGQIIRKIYKGAHIIYEIDTGSDILRAQVHPGEVFLAGEPVAFTFRRTVML